MSLPEDLLLKQLKTLASNLNSVSPLSGARPSVKRGKTPTNDTEQPSESVEVTLNRIIRSVSQKRRRTIHQLSLISEAGGACQRCDERFHPYVYDFHHRNPALKSFSLDRSVFGKKLSELRKEASKCHLLCSNCHREVHTFNDTSFLELTSDGPGLENVVYEARNVGFEL